MGVCWLVAGKWAFLRYLSLSFFFLPRAYRNLRGVVLARKLSGLKYVSKNTEEEPCYSREDGIGMGLEHTHVGWTFLQCLFSFSLGYLFTSPFHSFLFLFLLPAPVRGVSKYRFIFSKLFLQQEGRENHGGPKSEQQWMQAVGYGGSATMFYSLAQCK